MTSGANLLTSPSITTATDTAMLRVVMAAVEGAWSLRFHLTPFLTLYPFRVSFSVLDLCKTPLPLFPRSFLVLVSLASIFPLDFFSSLNLWNPNSTLVLSPLHLCSIVLRSNLETAALI